MANVSRLAILIGTQSPGNDFLAGVRPDLENMKRFLLSPCGGAWQPSEINTFHGRPFKEILRCVEHSTADYCIIYFSGHGFANDYGDRFLSMTDCHMEDLYLLNINASPRILMLSDSCRQVPGATIGAIPWPREEWLHTDGYSEARAVFNQYILNSPFGRMIVHAAAHGYPARDNRQGDGGEFTLSLLDGIYDKQKRRAFGPIYMKDALQAAEDMLDRRGVAQHPDIVYEAGSLNVPFAQTSAAYKILPSCPQRHPNAYQLPGRKKQASGLHPIVTFGGIALGLYALSRL